MNKTHVSEHCQQREGAFVARHERDREANSVDEVHDELEPAASMLLGENE